VASSSMRRGSLSDDQRDKLLKVLEAIEASSTDRDRSSEH
jgi:hypothetical protein